MQSEENEKLKSQEIRQVVRKLIKLMHTGSPASFRNRKPKKEMKILGWKWKSKERNTKNEVLVKTETLKFTEK